MRIQKSSLGPRTDPLNTIVKPAVKMASPPRPVIEILRKRTVVIEYSMVNIVIVLLIGSKYCLENIKNSISKHLNFKIFWRVGACPQTPVKSLRDQRSNTRLPPTVFFQWGRLLQNLLTALSLCAASEKGFFFLSSF